MRWRNRRKTHDRGAVAVEFALVAPILLLLVFGIIQYGLYFWAAQGGASAAREAARRAAVGDMTSCADFRTHVRDRIDDLGSGGGAATVTRTYANGPGNTAAAVEVGDVVTVRVTFNTIDLQIPLLPFGDGSVTQEAESRVENVPTAPEVC
jgi:Flp pilus assembly protein TadG